MGGWMDGLIPLDESNRLYHGSANNHFHISLIM